MSKAKFEAARELIEEKRYEEARALLGTIDDPKAREWLELLDSIAPAQLKKIEAQREAASLSAEKRKRKRRLPRWVWVFMGLVILYAIFGQPGQSGQRSVTRTAEARIAQETTSTPRAVSPPTASATITRTPAPSATSTNSPTVTLSATVTQTPIPTASFTATASATISKTPPPSTTASATATLVFSESEYVRELWDGLFILAGGRQVETIQVADGRAKGGERVIIISYLTTESTQTGYVEEWIDLFSAVAATIREDDLDVDSVTLVAGTPTGQAVGTLTASVEDLLAFHRGEISRGDFISRLQIVTF